MQIPDPAFNILTWPKRIARGALKVHVWIEGDPISKQRPRFQKLKSGKVYTPKHTKEAEQVIAWSIKAAHRELLPDADSAFGVRVLFRTKDYQRRDIDNMCKLIFDACNALVWHDDRQVDELIAHVFRRDPNPGTELAIYTLPVARTDMFPCRACGRHFKKSFKEPTVYCSKRCLRVAEQKLIALDTVCAQCGKAIHLRRTRLEKSKGKKFYCSRECKSLNLTVELTCGDCGKQFRRPKSLMRGNPKHKTYCSEDCIISARRKQATKYAVGICVDCGGPTSKKQYKRCDGCVRALRRFRSLGAKPKAQLGLPITEAAS